MNRINRHHVECRDPIGVGMASPTNLLTMVELDPTSDWPRWAQAGPDWPRWVQTDPEIGSQWPRYWRGRVVSPLHDASYDEGNTPHGRNPPDPHKEAQR